MEYLEGNKLVVAECHGFIGGRSCLTVVSERMMKIQEAIEVGDIPILLGIDISSAFDCLSRGKLLRLLEQLKLSQHSIDLIKSYFRDRKEFGVMQGSGLSPAIVLLYFFSATEAVQTCQDCNVKLKKR